MSYYVVGSMLADEWPSQQILERPGECRMEEITQAGPFGRKDEAREWIFARHIETCDGTSWDGRTRQPCRHEAHSTVGA